MPPRTATGPRRRLPVRAVARAQTGAREDRALRLIACAAAVLGAGLAPGCASGPARWQIAADSFRVRLEPAVSGGAMVPVVSEDGEWFEDTKGTLASCRVALPCGFELGAGAGSGDYNLGCVYLVGDEDGVRVWKAEAAWEFGSTNFVRVGARHEAVDDAHVIDYEPRPGEERYDSSARTYYVLAGRAFGSVRIMAGVARIQTDSDYFCAINRWGFGLSSRHTLALVSVDTPAAQAPVFARLEGAFAPGEMQGNRWPSNYWLSASVGVTF